MLPMLRIFPVGGVLLAIMLLVLALNPPASMHAQLAPRVVTMRGSMIEQSEHPEWRQFLIQAAIRRADELNRLRELPDMPASTGAAPAAVAGLPTERSETDPEADGETGSTMQPPPATIPIDIGETSAFELPVAASAERSPVIRTPQRVKARDESRIKATPRVHRAKALTRLKSPDQFDLFKTMFGEQRS